MIDGPYANDVPLQMEISSDRIEGLGFIETVTLNGIPLQLFVTGVTLYITVLTSLLELTKTSLIELTFVWAIAPVTPVGSTGNE